MTTPQVYAPVPPDAADYIAIPATLLGQACAFLDRYGSWDPEAAHLAATFEALRLAPKLPYEADLDPA